jgi:phosphatidylglycerol:prolipoprotein diacylglycerol transferase
MAQALATITIDIDPVLHLGGLAIHWYGVMYAVAFATAYQFGAMPYMRARGIPREMSERVVMWVIVFGLLGARLYYVVQNEPPQGGSWLSHPQEIIAVWHGGMAFFGAIIAAFLTMGVLAWRYRLDFWVVADSAAVFAVIGQPIGRIGNIINGDILGAPSSLPWATAYANSNAVLQKGFFLGQPYQPAGAYELIGTLIIGAVLFAVLRRRVPRGALWISYLALSADSQYNLFCGRAPPPTVALGLKQAQWTAIVQLLVAVPLIIWIRRRGLLDFSTREQISTAGADDPPESPGSAPPRSEPAAAQVTPGRDNLT